MDFYAPLGWSRGQRQTAKQLMRKVRYKGARQGGMGGPRRNEGGGGEWAMAAPPPAVGPTGFYAPLGWSRGQRQTSKQLMRKARADQIVFLGAVPVHAGAAAGSVAGGEGEGSRHVARAAPDRQAAHEKSDI